MSVYNPRSPGTDPERGAKRRKVPYVRLNSESPVPVIDNTAGNKFSTRPWLTFWSSRTRLFLVLLCFCLGSLAGMLRSVWLPLLAKETPGVSSHLSHEASPARYDRDSVYQTQQKFLDDSSTLQHQDNAASTSLELMTGSNVTRRFLTFLPHSGFNNQRIALENAMLLAYILNCTLIAPPVRLGTTLPYRHFDLLNKWTALASRPKPQHCIRFPSLPECVDYNSFVQMPWCDLVDFTSVRKELQLDIIFMHGSQTPLGFLQKLDIRNESTTFLKDSELYQYLIHDFPSKHGDPGSLSRYRDELRLDYLRKVVESTTAIHFGTLFGSGRLKLRGSNYTAARTKIHGGMIISHQAVLGVADAIRSRIVDSILDNPLYFAVHVRVGERKFKGSAKQNGRLIWWKLITELGVPKQIGIELEHNFLRSRKKNAKRPIPPDLAFFKNLSRPTFNRTNSQASPYGTPSCPSSSYLDSEASISYLGAPLFIATDAPHPRAHSSLSIFFATFPCVFVLSDFSEELIPLDHLRDADGFHFGTFLKPLVDAVVAGHAIHVVGTQNSTFSDFVTSILHPAYSRSG